MGGEATVEVVAPLDGTWLCSEYQARLGYARPRERKRERGRERSGWGRSPKEGGAVGGGGETCRPTAEPGCAVEESAEREKEFSSGSREREEREREGKLRKKDRGLGFYSKTHHLGIYKTI